RRDPSSLIQNSYNIFWAISSMAIQIFVPRKIAAKFVCRQYINIAITIKVCNIYNLCAVCTFSNNLLRAKLRICIVRYNQKYYKKLMLHDFFLLKRQLPIKLRAVL